MILSRTATDSFTLNVRKAASARGLSVSIALGWEAAFLSFKLYYLWIIREYEKISVNKILL